MMPSESELAQRRQDLADEYGGLFPASFVKFCQGPEKEWNYERFFACFDQPGYLVAFAIYAPAKSLDRAFLFTSMCQDVWGMLEGMVTINEFDGHWCVALDSRNQVQGREPGVVLVSFEGIWGDSYGLTVEELGDDGERGGLYRLADSFDEFLANLLTEDEFDSLVSASPHRVDQLG